MERICIAHEDIYDVRVTSEIKTKKQEEKRKRVVLL